MARAARWRARSHPDIAGRHRRQGDRPMTRCRTCGATVRHIASHAMRDPDTPSGSGPSELLSEDPWGHRSAYAPTTYASFPATHVTANGVPPLASVAVKAVAMAPASTTPATVSKSAPSYSSRRASALSRRSSSPARRAYGEGHPLCGAISGHHMYAPPLTSSGSKSAPARRPLLRVRQPEHNRCRDHEGLHRRDPDRVTR